MMTDVSDLYFDWLMHVIRDHDGFKVNTHHKLIEHLHNTPFIVALPNDQPRESDGIDLRWRFAWESGHMGDELLYTRYIPDEMCSVLEMMVALAFRADENFTRVTNDDTTVSWIFWMMVRNLGLLPFTDGYFDQSEVDRILYNFNTRNYKPDGDGGLFKFKDPNEDMRQIEIWYQLCWWYNGL